MSKKKIILPSRKKERVVVIGLGYVGLPLAVQAAQRGYRVTGIDLDSGRVKQLRRGVNVLHEETRISSAIKKKIFTATTNPSVLRNADIVIICVPTPVDQFYNPDLGPVESAARTIAQHLHRGQMIILESTVNPGVSEEIVKPILEKTKLRAGRDFDLVHCPERINPGDPKWHVGNIPRCVGATTPKGTERAAEFYRSILEADVRVMKSIKEAEATKIVENSFRDINIAFVNELARSFDALDIDLYDVLQGAANKPFAFMPHWPSIGVGGHCFDGQEWVTIRWNKEIRTMTFAQLDDLLETMHEVKSFRDGKIVFRIPSDLDVLSYDMETRQTVFQPMSVFTRRLTTSLVELTADYNVKTRVTDKHPIILQRDQDIRLQWAKDVRKGDRLLLTNNLPEVTKPAVSFDLLALMPPTLQGKIRVKLHPSDAQRYQRQISNFLTGVPSKRDFIRDNSIPAAVWRGLEHRLRIPRRRVLLGTGRGPSFSQLPAIFTVDASVARLLGYYASEGCITTEKKTSRIRFTFHPKEIQTLTDLRNILKGLGIAFSEYRDPHFQAHHIKISSAILAHLFKKVFGTGVDCYTMRIPSVVMGNSILRGEVLKGIMRGDGGVDYRTGQRAYTKNGRHYHHHNTSLTANYFTSSPELFQQVVLLLLERGIIPNIERRVGLLRISGNDNLQRLRGVFLDQKAERLEEYFRHQKKIIRHLRAERSQDWTSVAVKGNRVVSGSTVYSLEVAQTNTVITTHGLVAHNCIPVDPYYLIERAKKAGFDHKFLSLAREINNSMPEYAVHQLQLLLNRLKMPIAGTRVAVLGLSYKANVGDIRESPSLKVIDLLKRLGAEVIVYDPFFPKQSTVKSLGSALGKAEAVIVAVNHRQFVALDGPRLRRIGVKAVVDGKNCLDKASILKSGIAYKGIGR